MTLNSTSLIYLFVFVKVKLGSKSKSKVGYDSEALILSTNYHFEKHSLVICKEILWNLHHFLVSFLTFQLPFLEEIPWGWLFLFCPLFCDSRFSFLFFCCGEFSVQKSMQEIVIFLNQVHLRVSNSLICSQGMNVVGILCHRLDSVLMHNCPCCASVIIVSYGVILFLNDIYRRGPSWISLKHFSLLC